MGTSSYRLERDPPALITEFGIIDGTVCVAYLAIVFGLAWIGSHGQHDNEDYFVGGRKMNWWVVGVSMFATSFSSLSFLGLPQRGAYQDLSFYLTILCIPFIITPILWFIFIPLYVRLNVSSGYEYLGIRFGPPVQKIGATLYSAYAMGWMGTMLYAVALTLQTTLGLSDTGYVVALVSIGLFSTIYTVMGGLKAVIWTDAMQAIVLGGAIVLVLLFAVGRIDGGWEGLFQVANEHHKLQMVHLEPHLLAPENFTAPNSLYTALAFGLFMYLPGYAVAQNMIQRFVCSGSLAAGRGVAVLSAVINSVLGLLFLFVGTALFAFYAQESGAGLPVAGVQIAKEDQILPYFVSTELPGIGLVGLILAGLFAAAMSTIDSGINGVSSVIVFDWMRGKQLSVAFSRALTALLGVLVVIAALLVPYLSESVLDITMAISGTFLGFLLAIYLLGIFVPRANLPGALIGLATGAVCFTAAWTLTSLPPWWFGVFTIFPTFVVGALSSLLFDPPPQTALVGTMLKDHRP